MSNVRTENLKALWADPKAKLAIILTGIVVVFGTVLGLAALKSKEPPQALQPDIKLSDTPNLNSVPGATSNPKYAEAANDANNKKFDIADQQGGTALPTPIKLDDSYKKETDNQLPSSPISPSPPPPPPAPAPAPTGQVANQAPVVMAGATSATALPPPQNLGRQVDLLVERWAPTGMVLETDYTGVKPPTTQPSTSASFTQAGGMQQVANQTVSNQKVLIRSGTILHAVLKTGVNSDEPGPVLAEIISGPYRGASVIGMVTGSNQNAENVVLQFNSLAPTNTETSLQMQGYAVNPDSSNLGLATDVDHHYLERFGLVFAAAFLQGYGQAVQQSGATAVVNPLGGTTVVNPTTTATQQSKIALGTVGQSMAQAFSKNTQRPTTIKVAAGTPIGILVMQDVVQQNGNQSQASAYPRYSTGMPYGAQPATSQNYQMSQQLSAAAQQVPAINPGMVTNTAAMPQPTGPGYNPVTNIPSSYNQQAVPTLR